MLQYLTDTQLYEKVICDLIPRTKRFLWLATADLKDMYIKHNNRMIPFLEQLAILIDKKIEIRLLHAKEPGKAFRRDFDKYPKLITGMERILCPRCHLKTIIIDGKFLYIGSANLTGAGIGAKNPDRRNFESGILTDEQQIVEQAIEQFDSIWRGDFCRSCQRKEFCADYKDILS